MRLIMVNPPVQSIFFDKNSSFLKQSLLLLTGVIFLAIASQLSIPLQPVPLTFQSAAVILIGMSYGSRQAAYVISAYFIAGACGLPVFADFSCGIANFVGPTGGYLVSFLPAAYVCGWLAERGYTKHILTSFATTLVGATIIFAGGLSFLATFIGFQKAITLGLMPFIVSEPIKLIAVAILTSRLWKSAN